MLPLLLLAWLVLVISGAAPTGLPPPMRFPASERAAQILPTGVARMREKENPTVPTASPAPAQLRLGPQNRAQQHVIGKDEGHYRATPLPIRAKLKMLPDLDCKNPRLWLWTLKLLKAPLVLPKRPHVVEAGQGDFHRRPVPSAFFSLERNNQPLREGPFR